MGTPASRSLSNTVRHLSALTARLISTPLMGIPVSTASTGTLQGNDVGMTAYWRTTTRVVESFAKTTSPIQSTHRYRWGTSLRNGDCFLVLVRGLTDGRTIGLSPCWSSRLANVVGIQPRRSMVEGRGDIKDLSLVFRTFIPFWLSFTNHWLKPNWFCQFCQEYEYMVHLFSSLLSFLSPFLACSNRLHALHPLFIHLNVPPIVCSMRPVSSASSPLCD